MKEEKVILDESLVLRLEDSTQPAKRIKQEPKDSEESKVFVDATTQTEVFDADLKVEKATQTDRPIVYVCKLCRSNKRHRSSESLVSVKIHFYFVKIVMKLISFLAQTSCV